MKVWVLNLKHRKDRRNRISKALEKEGVEYKIFTGLYWQDESFRSIIKLLNYKIYDKWQTDKFLDFETGKPVHWYNRKVNLGEVAVATSTILMWEDILKSGDEMVLCLQDDTVWKEGELKKLMNLVETKTPDSDLIYLCGYPVNGYDYEFKKIDDDYEIPEYMYNAHAIVYKRKTIEHILANGYRNHLMSLDEYLMILGHTTSRMDVAEDLGIVSPLKYIKVINSENILEQINDIDEVTSDIRDTPEI